MAETIIGHIKAVCSLNLPNHRAPINAFLYLLAALTAYQLNPINPIPPSFLSAHCQHKNPLSGLYKLHCADSGLLMYPSTFSLLSSSTRRFTYTFAWQVSAHHFRRCAHQQARREVKLRLPA
jgi:hypothetical protein